MPGETKVFWVFLFFLQKGQLTEHTPWCQVRGLPLLPLLQLEGQQVRPGHHPRDLPLPRCGSASSRGTCAPRLARASQVRPDPPAPPQAARRGDVRGSWPRPSPGLWAGRETPSAHSWLFLVGSGHFPSPPPPSRGGAAREGGEERELPAPPRSLSPGTHSAAEPGRCWEQLPRRPPAASAALRRDLRRRGRGRPGRRASGREGAGSALRRQRRRRRPSSSRRPSTRVDAGLRKWLVPLSVWKLFSPCSLSRPPSPPSPRRRSGSR